MVRRTDHLDMTIAVDRDIKNQTKQTNIMHQSCVTTQPLPPSASGDNKQGNDLLSSPSALLALLGKNKNRQNMRPRNEASNSAIQ